MYLRHLQLSKTDTFGYELKFPDQIVAAFAEHKARETKDKAIKGSIVHAGYGARNYHNHFLLIC